MPRRLTEERRQEILDAACALFGTRGYQSTNVSDIATELQMGHGTFYRYFENKRDLFDRLVDDVLGRITAVTRGKDPTDPATLKEHARHVDQIGRELFAAFMHDVAATRLVFYEALGLDEDIRARVQAAFDALAELTAAYLRNGTQKGYLRPDLDATTASRALAAIVFEGIRRTIDAAHPEEEADKWIATYQMLARGLVAD